ncbi:MAG: 30S ribosomal protein S6 [Lewinellaceae bacterium]|nr:30S ribosomal protein S6 [Phaeodactylibacter sp.]MCB9350046.1 30S ribosomal protein S6 [Lewinellaceae bacterium]
MKNYEVTFIVDPVLSGEEIKATAQTYVEHLKSEGCKIVHVDEMGLSQMAYPINKRTSGVYYCIEFEAPSGEFIDKMELALRRDERIMRFLSVKLDKYGVKYNADKRAGKIGKVSKKKKKTEDSKKDDRRGDRRDDRRDGRRDDRRDKKPAPTPAQQPKEPVQAAVAAAPKKAAAAEEEE